MSLTLRRTRSHGKLVRCCQSGLVKVTFVSFLYSFLSHTLASLGVFAVEGAQHRLQVIDLPIRLRDN